MTRPRITFEGAVRKARNTALREIGIVRRHKAVTPIQRTARSLKPRGTR